MCPAAPKTLSQRIGDMNWMAKQLAFGLARSALPVHAHVGLMHWRARLHGHLTGVPDHVRENFTSVFGDELDPCEIDRVARRFVEFSKRKDLMMNLPAHASFVGSHCWDIQGLEYLDEALAQGRGAMLVTGHFGFGRMIGPVLQASGYELLVLRAMGMESERRRRLKGITEHAKGTAAKLINHKVSEARADLDIRPIINALAQNKVTKIAGDGLRSSEFELFHLLGKEYPFPTGFMKIAAMCGAAVLPAFAGEGRVDHAFRVEILPALRVNPNAGVRENLERFAQVFDHQLQRAPHQWHRWKVKDIFRRVIEWSKSEQRWSTSFNTWCFERDLEERDFT